MANATVAQKIDRRNVARALHAARAACQQDRRWLNAVNRAALNLEACPWQFDGETLVIASATTQGTRYTVTSECCQCKAHRDGRPCWHRAARRLLVKAAEMAQQPAPAKTMAELQAAVDALFA